MMSQQSRRELLAVVVPRYRAAQGTDRKRILNEFVASSGFHRKYAIQLLNHPPKSAQEAAAGAAVHCCGARGADHLLACHQWHL